jgi:hypothetical protein
MVEERHEYHSKWLHHVETMLPGLLRDKKIYIAILEGGTLNVQENDGHYNAFSLGKGHDSILDK